MSESSASHTTFVIERLFPATPRRVFRAWSDPEIKRRWFACHDDMINTGYEIDFRPGGREMNRVETPSGGVHLFQSHILDIVPDARIIYAYEMSLNGKRLSASLATVEFAPAPEGARMVFTEQVVFLDGYIDREDRIRGTEMGLDRLALELRDDLPRQ